MDWVGLASRNIVSPAVALRDGSRHLRYAREYEQTQRWSEERLHAYRWARLQNMLRFAFAHSSFYRSRFLSNGVRPEDIRNPEDLQALPRVSKRDLQEHWGDILVAAPDGAGHVQKVTSGSTGTPLRVSVDRIAMAHKRALTVRHNAWAEYRVGDAVGLIWGDVERPRSLRGRLRRLLLDRYEVLDSQRMDARTMESFAQALKRRRIRCVVGQAQPLHIFAEFVLHEGIDDLPVRTVIPTGMMLHAKQRQFMEQALSWEVFDRYGAEETSVIASECEAHAGLHTCAEGLWLEVVTGDRMSQPGEEGELLVTDLVNTAMPLIRYEIGDMVVPGDGNCPCGRSLPGFRRISGRTADCIVSPNGFVVSGIAISDHVASIPGIRQMQILQDRIDHLLFRIARGPAWDEDSLRLLGELVRRVFGGCMRFDCEFVQRIGPEANGKYRFSMSTVTAEYARVATGTPGV
jgi:phenylacetate-CoA ligase